MQDSDSHLFCFCWKHTRVGQLANLTHHRVSFSHVQPQTHAQLSSSVIYDSHLTVGVSNKPMGSLLIVIYKNKLPGQHCKGGIENGRQASHCAVILQVLHELCEITTGQSLALVASGPPSVSHRPFQLVYVNSCQYKAKESSSTLNFRGDSRQYPLISEGSKVTIRSSQPGIVIRH